MYLADDSGLGRNLKSVDLRRPAAEAGSAPKRRGGLGGFGFPVMDVQCPDPPGCAPVDAAACGGEIRAAVREAIRLANNAADKLEAAIAVPPASRNADAKRTAARFIRFFGHDPARAVTWAGNEESGVSVAKRFRAVANELNGGRRVIFQCRPTTADCAREDLTCCMPRTTGFFHEDLRNTVSLCDDFWNRPADLPPGLSTLRYRAGIIIHEMLHMLFRHLRDVGHGRIRNACYEGFALDLAGSPPDPFDICNCRGTPCPAAV